MNESVKQDDSQFLYDAFISYRHVEKDRHWAEWLIEALESYRVPKALVAKGYPPRLRKIFRDEDEMPASGDLNDQIKKALQVSRFLIVVCSPYTPRSKWVDREIELFKEFGRDDQVLALLTEGEPYDSFPARLLERHRIIAKPDGTREIVKENTEPLAADVRPRSGMKDWALRQQALLRLAACLLGVSYDTLKQREAERQRRTFRIRAAAASVAMLVLGAAGLGYWDYSRPKQSYFSEIVWRWGLPEGLGPLTKADRSGRGTSYAVTTRQGRVTEVKRVNSGGMLLDSGEDGARRVFSYRSDGALERVAVYDENNKHQWDEVHLPGAKTDRVVVSFEKNNAPEAQSGIQSLGLSSSGGQSGQSEITRHALAFDDKGLLLERRYQDAWGTPRNDAQSSFGKHFSYSPAGQVVRIAEIQADGSEAVLKNGSRAVVTEYDKSYRMVRRTNVGADNQPQLTSEGWATFEYTYDRFGNRITLTSLDASGKPIVNQKGWAKVVGHYDDRGNRIEDAYFGAKGNPVLSSFGVAKIAATFDERGLETSRTFLGIDGSPVLNKDGVAKWANTYDELGRRIVSLYYGVDGRLLPSSSDRAAKITRKFDERGNLIEIANFDGEGNPRVTSEGFAKIQRQFDDRDRIKEIRYFGADGKPTLFLADQAARVTAEYDPRGNRIKTAFFGIDGEPYLGDRGYATYLWRFDSMGNLVEVQFLDADGKPVPNKSGFARRVAEYDNRGNVIKNTFLDMAGQPVLAKDSGNASYVYAYDEHGNRTEVAFYGVDGKPVLGAQGYFKSVAKYDARGNVLERTYFGTDDKPIVTRAGTGVARTVFSYDDLGQLAAAEFFDDQGKAVKVDNVVGSVAEGSPAARSGLRVDDQLLSYDGKAVLTGAQFVSFVENAGYGVPHILEVRRGGDVLKLKVPPGKLGIEVRYRQVQSDPAATTSSLPEASLPQTPAAAPAPALTNTPAAGALTPSASPSPPAAP